jgi:hypothetical protein
LRQTSECDSFSGVVANGFSFERQISLCALDRMELTGKYLSLDLQMPGFFVFELGMVLILLLYLWRLQ